ncbi:MULTISPECIES: mycothiol transferase [unclassified Rathayibacter]|uniref:mycothiol transferase n=1 Tax=unclassified Rathayibacter TaxID=2609250 RepID=UPI00188C4B06|nr:MULTISPECIES: DinB family protein [unclassified Rathayibacter]MBF4461812.1 DinB family protein [Rathayibacter sp. VKM Ac-2879]MBF4503225.1 DinB family protein [Rathayibacter sp. VKM Ac-2878]
MTASIDLLRDAFGRVHENVHAVLEDSTPERLAFRADARANSPAWLVWHLLRVQDDHLAPLAGHEQAWTAEGFHERSGLPFAPAETGFGHDPEQVAALAALPAPLLASYADAVHERTLAFLDALDDSDLERVVDDSWDPPVTLGVRLVSVVDDDAQHIGQAAFAMGLAERAES